VKPEGIPIVRPDLIPMTSWGSSLSNLLTKPSWDSIRHPMIRWAGGCQICSAEQSNSLDCHEVWAYSMPPSNAPEGAVGLQRLMALAVVCSDCHSMFHLGHARMTGTAHVVKRRLMDINQWSEPDYKLYTDQQERLGYARANCRWALDVQLVRKAAPLIIKAGKSAWSYHDDDGGYLTAPAKYTNDECFTVILGASFKVGSRVIAEIDTAQAKEGLTEEAGDFPFAQWIRQRRIKH
jgi:hypothetical protein